ncbi:MAG: GDSL-type esterase/lipase family protein [Planctomycetota bacterium]|jgi:lysophospholipase L1-like esterase
MKRKLISLLLAAIFIIPACTFLSPALPETERVKGPPDVPLRTNNAYGHWPRHEACNARMKQGHVNLIFVGDSITQRWDRQGIQVWQKYYSHRNAVNLGVDGDRTQNVLWRLDHGNIDGVNPKVAIVMIGTNNSDDGDTPEQIARGIIAVCKRLRRKLPKTKIILHRIFPRGPKPSAQRDLHAEASRIASRIADGKMIFYEDIGDRFLEPDGSISTDIMYDYVHLTAKGYQIWAQAIEPRLKELLGEKHSAVTAAHRHNSWTVRYEAMNDRAKCGYVDLIFIGDSITQGWENTGHEAWEKYYDRRKAVNLGISGDRTQHVLWRLDNGNVDGLSPKAAVVMIGTNNLSDNRNTVEQTADGVKAVCRKLREKLPQTKILLLAIFPRQQQPGELREKVSRTNELIARIADGDMIDYLDIGDKFVEADGSISAEIMPDFLHLSPKGYQIWANAIEPKLTQLMGKNRGQN